MSSKMAPRLESPTKLKTTFPQEVVPHTLKAVSLMNDSLFSTDQSSNDKESKNHFKPLEGTPERGGYETTAVDNQVLVQDSSESAASSPRSFELDSFGFIRHLLQPRADEIEDKIPTFAEHKRNERRTQKWNVLLNSNFTLLRRRRYKLVVKRLRKGVPHAVRPQVWAALCETEQKMKQNPGLYKRLVRESAQGQTSPSSSAAATSPDVERAFQKTQDIIERDIHRTFPRHSLFYDIEEDNEPKNASSGEDTATAAGFCNTTDLQEMIRDFELNGTTARQEEATACSGRTTPAQKQKLLPQQQSQRRLDHPDANSPETILGGKGGQASLRRVLKAYSLYDREIGYCQGMNFIAGMFLTLVPEEQAFWMLVAVMYDEPCKMRGLFAEGMRETHMVLHVAEKLVHQFLPKLAKHFDKEHIHVTMYATQWLLTQYTSSFRFDLVTRVWDSFLGEGWKITYRVMLSILQHYQSALLRMSFEEILAFMRELPGRINGPVVFDASIKIPLRRKHIAKYEKQWHAQQQQQQQST